MEKQIFYNRSANFFEEAIPLGNGHLGAMCYGKTDCEKISLNDDTLYSGANEEHIPPENAPKIWKKIQKLCAEGRDSEAYKAALGFTAEDCEVYLPLADIFIKSDHRDVSDYRRGLIFSDGLAYVDYLSDGVTYHREVFASKSRDCITVHFSADKPGALSMNISFSQRLKITNKKFTDSLAIYDGVAPCGVTGRNSENTGYIFGNEDKCIHFTNIFRIEQIGGEKRICDDGFVIGSADEVTVYIFSKTSFNTQNYHEVCLENANRPISYDELKAEHIRDFSELYNRAELSLSDSESNIATDKRIIGFDGTDLGLFELLFNYGRYLLISSSRPGSMATNLQGIWNERQVPMWNSAYTVNINTEMNYWPAHTSNLGECFEPFIALMKILQRSGKKTAEKYYDAPGFVCHHNSDIFGHTNPVGRGQGGTPLWSFWNMASGWMACQLYDEYEYTMDKAVLKDTIYPIMKDAALFYLHIMVRNENGKYMVSPSTSPENRFFIREDSDEWSSISRTTAMTAAILFELFSKLIKATYILDTDYEFRNELESVIKELWTPQIGADGRLMEWYEERKEFEVRHRHVSHLFGLYPGEMISPEKTPELADACKKSLLVRGDVGTGWSLAWKVNLWARLLDGNHALAVLKRQLTYVDPKKPINYVNGGGTYPNLMDAHPPFQIDGNFGVCAGIIEMLMQSKVGKIKLLPALPDEFKNGYIRGIKAKGNVTVSIWWENNRVKKAVLSSPIEQQAEISMNDKTVTVTLGKAEIELK